MAVFRSLLLVFATLLGLGALSMLPSPASATPQRVQNTATLDFTKDGTAQSLSSNTTILDFDRQLYPTTLTFYRLPSDFDFSTLSCQAGPPTAIHGAIISPPVFSGMGEDDEKGEANFAVVLRAAPGDTLLKDVPTQYVQAELSSGDTEWLIVTETAPLSGVYVGAFRSGSNPSADGDCTITSPPGTSIDITFPSGGDWLASSDHILIDPYGTVFNSRTGAFVDGATVTLINDATGQPARVYGDDGHTPYPSTVVSGRNVTDSAGNVYDYHDGDYRFPFTDPGTYHIQVTAPGYAAPSEVSPDALPVGANGPFNVNVASYGLPFTLVHPEPLQADIPVDPIPQGVLTLEKTTLVRDASPGDLIPYHLHVANPQGQLMRQAVITDTLPAGLRYKAGTSHGVAEPALSADGRTLTFTLPDLAPGAALDLSYAAEVQPSAPTGDAVNHAYVQIPGSPASPDASASVRIHSLLFSDAMTVIGRVTEGDCDKEGGKGIPGIRILLDDGTYVVTDRDGLYHFEGVRKGRHVVQLDTNSFTSAYQPVVCHDDTRWAGSDISRFVEGEGGTLQRVDFMLKPTGKAAQATTADLPPVADGDVAAGARSNWLDGQAPGIDWLFPGTDHNPRAPALRVVIKHAPGQRVALTVNGVLPDPLAFDGTDQSGKDPQKDVAVSVWTGLPLQDGDNVLVAKVLDASGNLVKTLTRTVHYANTPYSATYLPEQSRLSADGKTQPLIAVRLTDRDGHPMHDGALAAFHLEPPYATAQALDMQQDRQLVGMDRADTVARVRGDDGIAWIALQPTTQPGQAHLAFNLTADKSTKTSDIRPWLVAADQDWVVVGFAAGTLGYDTLAKNTKRYWLPKDRNLHSEGQVSFYAKGRIKGSWLLTMAYDSDHAYDPETGLLSTIDPDRYYTVYGDGSGQGYDASTSRKLYLRLERKDAYVMLGDFETGMNDTQLARFSRTLNGVRAGFHNDRVTASAFAAHSSQRYARDEIQGNGLSGPYRLSAGGLIANSDKVTIETRDRFRSEKIISSKELTRHIDYDIDPDAGTIVFKEPILSRDENFNPVFIVVDYEIEGAGDKRLVAGARVAAKVTDKVEVGASLLRDDSLNHAQVAAADVKAQLGANTEMRGEVARGGAKGAGADGAYLVEVEHHGKTLDALAYVRHQDDGFGVGQQNFTEAGTHKVGVDMTARLTDRATFTGSVWRQESLTTPETRTAFDARLDFRRKTGTWFVEATGAGDENLAATAGQPGQSFGKQVSRLVSFGGTQNLMHDKLQLTGQVQAALGGAQDNVQFPIRNSVSAAYRISDTVRLVAAYETADGAGFKAHTARAGFDLTPWHGAKLAATLNQLALGENGARSFAQFGLSQSLPVGKHWTLDATFDASKTLKGRITADAIDPFQASQSFGASNTAASDDVTNGSYTSATFGATYRADTWSWNGRVEARRADLSHRYGVISNAIRTLGDGKTVASSLRIYDITDRFGRKAQLASADVELAWRPLDSHWSALERLEYVHDRADAGVIGGGVLGVPMASGENLQTTRLINNISLNYRSDLTEGRGLEASVYYGAKQVHGKLASDSYDGFIDVLGLDVRKSLSPRFDLAFALSQQTAHDSGVRQMSYGPSLGFSPKKDVWISVGYNVAGYRDPDATDRYTQQGPYVTVRVKFDQSGLRNLF